MLTNVSLAQQAWNIISERGLDKIRCCLTGAPYATLTQDEIIIALEGDVASTPSITVDRLVDNWELRALSFNTGTLPSLRGVKTHALVPMIRRGQEGQVRILTYMLTRLLFPKSTSEFDSEFARERMLFAITCHDAALKWPSQLVAEYVQHLVAIDSFCAMPYWRKLYGFESRLSKVGLWAAEQAVQRTFADPILIAEDMVRVGQVIKFMFNLMVYVAGTDGVAGYSGNRMAQQILYLHKPEVVGQPIPLHQKQLSQSDIDRQAKIRALNSHQELRIAHSAIFGKGVTAGTIRPSRQKASSAADNLKVAKRDATQTKFDAALSSLKTNPDFQQKLAAMMANLPAPKKN